MDRMTKFANDFRELILKKIKDNKLDLPKDNVRHTKLVFNEVDGELRYFIDKDIVDNIPEDIMKEIELLWTLGQ